MKSSVCILALLVGLLSGGIARAAEDTRQLVEIPQMMQGHMLSNMRDHLKAINEILAHMAKNELDATAEIAESRLGMSSLDDHGARHMAKFMPHAPGRHKYAPGREPVCPEGTGGRAPAGLPGTV